MKRCYIAGPISGLPVEVFTANFNEGKEIVTQIGFTPVCPTDLPHIHDKSWESHMKEDLTALLTCDCIFLLRGWQKSRGARIEAQLAKQLGMDAIEQEVLDEAERVSSSPEAARQYLESQGYDVDAVVSRGMEMIRGLLNKRDAQ